MEDLNFLQMLDLAMLAYSDTPTSNIFEKIAFENCKDSGVQYYVGRKNETLIISFRGTDSVKDFVTDIHFWKKRVPYNNFKSKIRIHSGFINSYRTTSVRGKIHEFVTDNVKNIYITGHSYGAALALLCAIDLQYNFPKKYYDVVVFGCPRVGNRAFMKSYNKRLIKTIRIENGNDMVTKIPFGLMGFRHAGVKIHIGFPRVIGIFSLRNHHCGNYYAKLWSKAC